MTGTIDIHEHNVRGLTLAAYNFDCGVREVAFEWAQCQYTSTSEHVVYRGIAFHAADGQDVMIDVRVPEGSRDADLFTHGEVPVTPPTQGLEVEGVAEVEVEPEFIPPDSTGNRAATGYWRIKLTAYDRERNEVLTARLYCHERGDAVITLPDPDYVVSDHNERPVMTDHPKVQILDETGFGRIV